ncbi:MAG: nucleotidyltransferase domain-containing protein [Prevotellaceae bacterium]|jgi:predicted nucleotidyltransferase|nr:nucleotidyltransferase domain-containing protein [Prevotellaceae bacterium]
MITHEEIVNAVAKTATTFPIKAVSYFGSYANGQQNNESDLDLLVEFYKPAVSLIMLSAIKTDIEDQLRIPVDVVHAPLPEGSLIKANKVVQVYG